MNYFIRKSGVVSGPFPEEDIRRRLSLNLLTSMDEASADGRAWRRIRQTPLWMPPSAASISASSGMAAGRRQPAPTTPAALHLRREAKREMENAARFAPRPARSEAFSTPQIPTGGIASPGRIPRAPAASSPVFRERRRFGNWWLALAIPCATIVVLAIIAVVAGDGSGGSGGASGATYEDEAFTGCEVVQLQLDQFDPKLHDFLLYITPSYSELKQTFQMVRDSEHVSENLQYANDLNRVRFYHDPSVGSINAFATAIDKWHSQEPEMWPSIMVCGGAGRFARVVAAAMTEFGDDESSLDLDELLGSLAGIEFLDNDMAYKILSNVLHVPDERYSDPAWLSRAKGISRGILMSILAHEAGHVALGHIWAWQKNKERNRNQEREADSFAHSVGSGTADADDMFWGNLLFDYAFAINEMRDGNSEMSRTHPYSEERLFNLIRDNQSIAQIYGITEDEMRKALNEARSKFR